MLNELYTQTANMDYKLHTYLHKLEQIVERTNDENYLNKLVILKNSDKFYNTALGFAFKELVVSR